MFIVTEYAALSLDYGICPQECITSGDNYHRLNFRVCLMSRITQSKESEFIYTV